MFLKSITEGYVIIPDVKMDKERSGIRLGINFNLLRTLDKKDYQEAISSLGLKIAKKLVPLAKYLPLNKKFVLFEVDVSHPYFFTEEGMDKISKFIIEAGEFGVSRIFFERTSRETYYLFVSGYATSSSDFFAFDETQLAFSFKKAKRDLLFKGVSVLGSIDHHFWDIYDFDVNDKAKLKALLIADKITDKFLRFCILPDIFRK